MHWTAVHAAGAHSRAQNEVPTLATRATARARLLICRGIVHVHDVWVAGAGAIRGAVLLPSHRHPLPCSHIGRADALRPQARPGLHGSPLVIPIQRTYTSRTVLPGHSMHSADVTALDRVSPGQALRMGAAVWRPLSGCSPQCWSCPPVCGQSCGRCWLTVSNHGTQPRAHSGIPISHEIS